MSKPPRSATLIVTPQILPNLLKLIDQKQKDPKRVRWLICENLRCDRGKNPFTVYNHPQDICPDCGSACTSMDDHEQINAAPGQPIGRIEVFYSWEPTQKIYRSHASLALEDYNPRTYGVYTRYMPRSVGPTERKMIEFLHSVNYRRICDPDLLLGPVGSMEHILDLSDDLADIQVSLKDLEAAWEANPLCLK